MNLARTLESSASEECVSRRDAVRPQDLVSPNSYGSGKLRQILAARMDGQKLFRTHDLATSEA